MLSHINLIRTKHENNKNNYNQFEHWVAMYVYEVALWKSHHPLIIR